ncbi:squalene/phytoene synthase family protein [Rickettsiales bacterium LUAb2]
MQVQQERFICGYLCNKNLSKDLQVLLTFYDEIARISSKTKEVSFMQIRLKWFMDGVTNLYKNQLSGFPVLDDLLTIITKYNLNKVDFITMLEARNIDKDYIPFNNQQEYISYAENTGGILWRMVMQMYGGNDEDQRAAYLVGSSFSIVGIIRNYQFDFNRMHYTLIFNKQEVLNSKNLLETAKNNIKPIVTIANSYLKQAKTINVKPKLRRLLLLSVFTNNYLNNIEKNMLKNNHTNIDNNQVLLKYKLQFILKYIFNK